MNSLLELGMKGFIPYSDSQFLKLSSKRDQNSSPIPEANSKYWYSKRIDFNFNIFYKVISAFHPKFWKWIPLCKMIELKRMFCIISQIRIFINIYKNMCVWNHIPSAYKICTQWILSRKGECSKCNELCILKV